MLPYLPMPLNETYAGEPNILAGIHKAYSWAIIRTPALHLCGYVQVPETHSLYKTDYNDCELSVHGGLTYGAEAKAPFWGYWIGFDCAHSGDFSPRIAILGTYRDIDYVQAECERLIDQLIDYKPTAKLLLKQELLAVVERFKDEKDYQDWKEAVLSL